jgi:tetratricopeptide (TPR) repeat protein
MQGNYKEAVRYLERAVELKPDDPVLNDHLGDALWRVGREREARFQWDQALSLKPEPEDEEKIKKKLETGLTGVSLPHATGDGSGKQAAKAGEAEPK